MESDSWSRTVGSASRRHHHQSRYAEASASSRDQNHRSWKDLLFEEYDGSGSGGGFGRVDEEESRLEFSCPFCTEDFDVVGLCCHIDDEHPIEAKNGVCPICTARVGMDLVGHMITLHGSFFKMQRRRKLRRGSSASQTMLPLLKRDFTDSNLQSFLRESSYMSPATEAPDPLLSSLICTPPLGEPSKDEQPESLGEESLINRTLNKKVERNQPSLSDKDQKERASRTEFVQGLVLSTIFDDYL